jgi:hypothetical protein
MVCFAATAWLAKEVLEAQAEIDAHRDEIMLGSYAAHEDCCLHLPMEGKVICVRCDQVLADCVCWPLPPESEVA